jgi:hypothetical protein
MIFINFIDKNIYINDLLHIINVFTYKESIKSKWNKVIDHTCFTELSNYYYKNSELLKTWMIW